MTFWCSDILMC